MGAETSRRDQIAGRLAMAWCCAALLALLLALANLWLWFGILVWIILVLAAAIGYSPQCRRNSILAALSGVFLLYTGFLLGIARTYRPDAPIALFLGLPVPTAFLLYGIWPCGLLLGLLYAFEFRRSVLPQDKLRQFLAEFGRKE